MAWRVAKSLEKLRSQVNARYPKRDKVSDGTIGDARHQASSSSDHNPHVKDGTMGVVTACDITHDPADGCDAGLLASVLLASRDPRIKYVIWNRKITSGSAGPSPWVSRKYTGSNPHDHHFHLSVKAAKSFYDDARDWAMPGEVVPVKPTAPQPKPVKRPTLLLHSTGNDVRVLQKALGVEVDGMFGPKTRAAVKAFQKKNKLVVDGKVGPMTWAKLAA
jgi:hypothetical protein